MPLSWRPKLNVLSVLTPDVSLHRCPPTSSPAGQLALGSPLTSVLLVFIHIKSSIVDCFSPTPVNSLWFFCSFPSCLVLSFLGKQTLLVRDSTEALHSQLLMKNKDVRDGSAMKLEPSSGIGTDPFVITPFRAVGSSPMGTGFITIYICEGSGRAALFSYKNTGKSYHLNHVLYRESTSQFINHVHLIFFSNLKAFAVFPPLHRAFY